MQEQPPNRRIGQGLHGLAGLVEEPVEAVVDAEHLPAVVEDGRLDRRSNHGVEPRGVSAAGEDSDSSKITHPAEGGPPEALLPRGSRP